MYVRRVIVDGVRSLSGPRALDLDFERPSGEFAGWTVVAGRNGSGKSTLLRAIVLALAGPARALQLSTSTTEWISHGVESGSAEVQIQIDSVLDRPKTGRLPANGRMWSGLIWKVDDDGAVPTSRVREVRPVELLSRNPSNVRKASWNGPWTEQPTGWFYAAYGPFRRLLGDSSDAQRLLLGPLPVARVTTLFREDASLAESVQWLRFHHLRRLEERAGAADLVAAVIALLNDGLLPDDFVADSVDSEGLWLRSGDERFPLDEMSDGYRAVAALVLDVVRSMFESYTPSTGEQSIFSVADDGTPQIPLPGVVLIDEVESHLHVSWQRRIGPWLCEHFPRVQFIVTTHSPYVCQTASPGGLIRLPGPTDEGSATVLDADEYRRIVHGSGDDAVLSELFGLDSVYTAATRRLRSELAEVEVEVMQGDADDEEVERYEELTAELQSSPLARVIELRDES